ncbi:M23 family metallopeptidase [Candidatus Woesebacteria bacterium]|nr:M23 family metallopeptidase [Candidatus Woesebacteria bacterium]
MAAFNVSGKLPSFYYKIQIELGFIRLFVRFLYRYLRLRGYSVFYRFEVIKDQLVDLLYRKRGRYARPFLHLGTLLLVFSTIVIGPVIFARDDLGDEVQIRGVLDTEVNGGSMYTQQAEEVKQFRGGEVIVHVVQEDETLSSVAQRYGLEVSTILWENNLTEKSVIKPGQELRILPVDGVRHQVARGETIYTIGKKYGLDESSAQLIVDYPFNEFRNDETFELATGQWLVVPEGVPPQKIESNIASTSRKLVSITADAGPVTATGSFIRPASGMITQGYKFYHKAVDIANRGGGPVLAADSGVVVSAGWDGSGYGNKIMIDHLNGNVTLYGHLSLIQVQVGQRVNRGDVIGQMGNTGRSTGTHLHFEVRQGGVFLNPLVVLGI